jgi:hypothetical protein
MKREVWALVVATALAAMTAAWADYWYLKRRKEHKVVSADE